jgi:uncharacterized protein (DUF2141 family)
MGALALSVLLLAGAPAAAAELMVSVNGLRSADGVVRLALYDRPELFPEKGEGLKIAVPARQGEVEAVFNGLSPGRYALALFHDEDGDDEFDRGFLGIPKEGYGFSNDARPFLGPQFPCGWSTEARSDARGRRAWTGPSPAGALEAGVARAEGGGVIPRSAAAGRGSARRGRRTGTRPPRGPGTPR